MLPVFVVCLFDTLFYGDITFSMLCCRTSINQIQACDALFLDFQLRSSWPNIFYTNTSMSPFNIVIRRGNSEEPVVTGPLSSIRVEMVVLSGDFAQEDWTKVEFKDNAVGAREGKGPLLKGNAITALTGGVGTFDDIKLTDNSSWTRSASFRLGAKVVHGNGIQDRIREARSEAFVVREKPRQCKCLSPLVLCDDVLCGLPIGPTIHSVGSDVRNLELMEWDFAMKTT